MLAIAALGTAFVLYLIPSNDYIFLPDTAHPVAPLVSVQGGHTAAKSGGIYFVDVIEEQANLLEQLFPGIESGSTLYSPAEIIAPGTDAAQQEGVELSEMASSQQIAAAVALRADGRKVRISDNGSLIEAIEPGSPAANRLEPTDVIVAVNGTPTPTLKGLEATMAARPVGSRVTFTVLRDGAPKRITLTTVPVRRGSHRGVVGVYLAQSQTVHLPIRVSIDAHGVGGPSAGLAFALEVLQQLGRNVDHGLKIAATGTLDLAGQVGPIGGIEQKTIGARAAGVDAFLVPAGQNAIDARKYADGLRIIPVESFQQALRILATLTRK
jgi:PDZ domain-containing protein